MENYGAWGPVALRAFSPTASHLAIRDNTPKSKVVAELYGCLSLSLIRANLWSAPIPKRSKKNLNCECSYLCMHLCLCAWNINKLTVMRIYIHVISLTSNKKSLLSIQIFLNEPTFLVCSSNCEYGLRIKPNISLPQTL